MAKVLGIDLGTTNSVAAVIDAGDPVVVEEFIYPGTLSALHPYSPKYLAVKSEANVAVCQPIRCV